MDNAAKRKKCKKQSRDLYFSLFSILFWSLAVSIAKSLCKKGSTLNLWYGSSSKVSEDSVRGRVTVILCVRSLSKWSLLNIIFKCYVLQNRNELNGGLDTSCLVVFFFGFFFWFFLLFFAFIHCSLHFSLPQTFFPLHP